MIQYCGVWPRAFGIVLLPERVLLYRLAESERADVRDYGFRVAAVDLAGPAAGAYRELHPLPAGDLIVAAGEQLLTIGGDGYAATTADKTRRLHVEPAARTRTLGCDVVRAWTKHRAHAPIVYFGDSLRAQYLVEVEHRLTAPYPSPVHVVEDGGVLGLHYRRGPKYGTARVSPGLLVDHENDTVVRLGADHAVYAACRNRLVRFPPCGGDPVSVPFGATHAWVTDFDLTPDCRTVLACQRVAAGDGPSVWALQVYDYDPAAGRLALRHTYDWPAHYVSVSADGLTAAVYGRQCADEPFTLTVFDLD